MIKIPPITGNIRSVPLSSYKEIIDNYLDKAGKIEQVLSIIQMGSFSKPGISDIDLIVTIKDGMRYPDWRKLSLKSISKDHKHAEVIAHDIFVIPESIAKNAEAYFYIDHQNVLKGKRLGGNICSEMIEKFKEFLGLEYALFSLDSIANMLLRDQVNLRTVILLISTMRHSSAIACDLKIITESERNELIKEIEKVRSDVLSSNYSLEKLGYLFEKFINLLHQTIKEISKNVTKEIVVEGLDKLWVVSSKSAMVGIDDKSDYLSAFLNIINIQKQSFISKYTTVYPVPVRSQMHIGAYLDGNEDAAIFFRKNFKKIKSFRDENEINTKARRIRGEIVRLHWEFLNKTGFLLSSGKAYCGLAYCDKKAFKSILRKKLLYYQLKKIIL